MSDNFKEVKLNDAAFKVLVLERLERQGRDHEDVKQIIKEVQEQLIPKQELQEWHRTIDNKIDKLSDEIQKVNTDIIPTINTKISVIETKNKLYSSVLGLITGAIISSIVSLLFSVLN